MINLIPLTVMKARRQFQSALLAVLLFPQAGGAQDIPTDIRQEIGKYMDGIARKESGFCSNQPKDVANLCQHELLVHSLQRGQCI